MFYIDLAYVENDLNIILKLDQKKIYLPIKNKQNASVIIHMPSTTFLVYDME